MPATFFEIPQDGEYVMIELVRAVPSDWSWVEGSLRALPGMAESGLAVPDVALVLSRYQKATYQSHRVPGKNSELDFSEMEKIFGRLMAPEIISFDGMNSESGQQIAVSWIERGYRGELIFFSGYLDNSKYDNPERCYLALGPWKGCPADGAEAGSQPPRIKLQWEPHYHGRAERLEPIISVCRSLGLREYQPVSGS
jgi:hypothetical protein